MWLMCMHITRPTNVLFKICKDLRGKVSRTTLSDECTHTHVHWGILLRVSHGNRCQVLCDNIKYASAQTFGTMCATCTHSLSLLHWLSENDGTLLSYKERRTDSFCLHCIILAGPNSIYFAKKEIFSGIKDTKF